MKSRKEVIHFLNNPFAVVNFSMDRALMLVTVTTVFGYFVGSLCGLLWNMFIVGKKSK